MLEKNDPMWSAIARWVFGFIRFQLSCGQTLNEIETSLHRAVGNGELYSFVKTFEDLKAANLKRINEERNAARP